jgi:type IV pilus assembly protein PilX
MKQPSVEQLSIKKLSMRHQRGMVMVLALLVLMSLTVLGVSSVSSSLMQSKMAGSMEKRSVTFDVAEAAIAGVVFESQDKVLLSTAALNDPLSDARGGNQIDLTAEQLSCFDDVSWTNRTMTSGGLTAGAQHTGAGNYTSKPEISSWSRTAFVREQSCIGSSNVIGGSNINCHVFMVKGCGQMEGSSYAVANTLNIAVFGPVAE